MTLSKGVTPIGKKFLRVNLQRIVDKRGRTSKNVWGDTGVKSIKVTVLSKKSRQFFQEIINWGDTVEMTDKQTVLSNKKFVIFFRKK